MTAATANELGLEHPSAIALADQLVSIAEPSIRRDYAAKALADRLADLALYVTLYRERYGHALNLERVIDADDLYGELVVLTVA